MFHAMFVRKTAGAAHSQKLDDGRTGHLALASPPEKGVADARKRKALFRELYLSHYHCHNHIHYHIHYHSPVATTGKTFDHWLRLVTTLFYRLKACFPYRLKHYYNASDRVIRLLLNTIHTFKTISPQEHSYLYRHSTIIALHGEVDKGVIQQILAQVTLKR